MPSAKDHDRHWQLQPHSTCPSPSDAKATTFHQWCLHRRLQSHLDSLDSCECWVSCNGLCCPWSGSQMSFHLTSLEWREGCRMGWDIELLVVQNGINSAGEITRRQEFPLAANFHALFASLLFQSLRLPGRTPANIEAFSLEVLGQCCRGNFFGHASNPQNLVVGHFGLRPRFLQQGFAHRVQFANLLHSQFPLGPTSLNHASFVRCAFQSSSNSCKVWGHDTFAFTTCGQPSSYFNGRLSPALKGGHAVKLLVGCHCTTPTAGLYFRSWAQRLLNHHTSLGGRQGRQRLYCSGSGFVLGWLVLLCFQMLLRCWGPFFGC